jgi:putative DNA primase/helicase
MYQNSFEVMVALPPEGLDPEGKPHDWDSAYRAFGAEAICNALVEARSADELPLVTKQERRSELDRLANLEDLEFHRGRRMAAKRLGVPEGSLDKVMKQHKAKARQKEAVAQMITTVAPWSSPVDGVAVLDRFARQLKQHVVMPEHGVTAVALWCMFAHAHDTATHSPILAIQSPAPRCGKTTVMRVLSVMVPGALSAANIRPAAIFRTIDAYKPTLLLDEADTFVRDSDELRGILNSGHEAKLAFVIRTVGDNHEPKKFSTWCPKAIALIGFLPVTLQDRSISITLRRKTPEEIVERLRNEEEMFSDLGAQFARWAADHLDMIRDAEPVIPEGLNDRAADNWRTMLAIADLVGGDWPVQARAAAVGLSGPGAVDETVSLEVRLLEDIRRVFSNNRLVSCGAMSLAAKLKELDDAPWADIQGGRGVSPRGIAVMLKPFGIKPRHTRCGSEYDATMFADAWQRYLTPPATH